MSTQNQAPLYARCLVDNLISFLSAGGTWCVSVFKLSPSIPGTTLELSIRCTKPLPHTYHQAIVDHCVYDNIVFEVDSYEADPHNYRSRKYTQELEEDMSVIIEIEVRCA